MNLLAALLDSLKVGKVDIVAADSGGAVVQMFLVRYPERVRTMLLTNCDTEPNSPPPVIKPILDMARTPLQRKQYHEFHNTMQPNPLAGIEAALKRSTVPVRMVWGARDTIFPMADAEYLDRTFPRSQGIRSVPEGKLFFQEEFPDVIAEEARRLWQVG